MNSNPAHKLPPASWQLSSWRQAWGCLSSHSQLPVVSCSAPGSHQRPIASHAFSPPCFACCFVLAPRRFLFHLPCLANSYAQHQRSNSSTSCFTPMLSIKGPTQALSVSRTFSGGTSQPYAFSRGKDIVIVYHVARSNQELMLSMEYSPNRFILQFISLHIAEFLLVIHTNCENKWELHKKKR